MQQVTRKITIANGQTEISRVKPPYQGSKNTHSGWANRRSENRNISMALHQDGALDQAPGEALAWLQDFISVDTINPLLPGSDPISLLIGSDPFSRPPFHAPVCFCQHVSPESRYAHRMGAGQTKTRRGGCQFSALDQSRSRLRPTYASRLTVTSCSSQVARR